MRNEENELFHALVVDDNEVNALILAGMLDNLLNISTDLSDNGMDAVIMSASTSYDIIFIDHLMPKMDGIQTTTAIRSQSAADSKTVIIALTADASDHVRNCYMKSGADDVYRKPLEREELIHIVNKWFPNRIPEYVSEIQKDIDLQLENELIRQLIKADVDIDFAAGIRNALGNPAQYINILEASIKDLQKCFRIIMNASKNNSLKQIQVGVHKLKSICTGIGAVEMLESAIMFEEVIQNGNKAEMKQQYELLIRNLCGFKEKLQFFLRNNINNEKITAKKPNRAFMSKEEYEHCLLRTIYYIRRYDYYSIIKEMESLVSSGRADFKQEFEKALMEIKEYKYERALKRMLKIKNKTVNETASN